MMNPFHTEDFVTTSTTTNGLLSDKHIHNNNNKNNSPPVHEMTADDFLPKDMSRRSIFLSGLMSMAGVGSITMIPRICYADEGIKTTATAIPTDDLDAFARQLNDSFDQKNDGANLWPNAASPLPLAPADLTTPPTTTADMVMDQGKNTEKAAGSSNDLESALEKAMKRKEIGPLTHG